MTDSFEQQVDVMRRSDEDYKAKCTEAAQLRQRVADVDLENERLKQDINKLRNRCAALTADCDRRQHTLDVVVKELTTKKEVLEHLGTENQRLKRDLDSSHKHVGEVMHNLKMKSGVNAELTRQHDSPASLYMQQCFNVGINPSMDVLRSLFHGGAVECDYESPVTYQQLNALCDVYRLQQSVNTEGWPLVEHLQLACESQECFTLVGELFTLMPTLKSAALHGVGDTAATSIAHALAVADHIGQLELPLLELSDSSFQILMKTILNRETLGKVSSPQKTTQEQQDSAAAAAAPVEVRQGLGGIVLRDLDLSRCSLYEGRSFNMCHGSALARVDLSGQTALQDNFLGEIIRASPCLTSLSVAGCANLSNDALIFINAARFINTLNLTECSKITSIKLTHVETLYTNLVHAAFVDCPELRQLPTPLLAFQCVQWNTPKLEELSFKGVSLSPREFQLLADCCWA